MVDSVIGMLVFRYRRDPVTYNSGSVSVNPNNSVAHDDLYLSSHDAYVGRT